MQSIQGPRFWKKQPEIHTKNDQKILKKIPEIEKDPNQIIQPSNKRKNTQKYFLENLGNIQQIPQIPMTPTMQCPIIYVMSCDITMEQITPYGNPNKSIVTTLQYEDPRRLYL